MQDFESVAMSHDATHETYYKLYNCAYSCWYLGQCWVRGHSAPLVHSETSPNLLLFSCTRFSACHGFFSPSSCSSDGTAKRLAFTRFPQRQFRWGQRAHRSSQAHLDSGAFIQKATGQEDLIQSHDAPLQRGLLERCCGKWTPGSATATAAQLEHTYSTRT